EYSRRYVVPFNLNSSWFYSYDSFFNINVTVTENAPITVAGNFFQNASHIVGRYGMPDNILNLDEWVADNVGVVKRYEHNVGTLNPNKYRTGWTLISYHLQ
ncbi:MAG TPA: hypothetical protein VKH37_01260, partial [Ferruginibacter sp.]|nr:hypothetical protein [Ferruginibacter sp.]